MQKFMLVLAVVFAVNFTATGSPSATRADDSGLVTAHRGSSHAAPENTASSIRQAIKDGAGYAELDVQETADGVIVLMHDDSAKRTTGIDKPMWKIPFDELRQASAGAWFHPQFRQERVPTLEEIIEIAHGKIKLNIELKNNSHQKRLAEQTVSIIERRKFTADCTVTSFDAALLRKVKQLNANIRTGLIVGQNSANREALFTNRDYEVLSAAYPLVDEAFMRLAEQHHKQVFVWTVNDKKTMNRMLKLGVDSIITNEPAQLVELLRQHRANP